MIPVSLIAAVVTAVLVVRPWDESPPVMRTEERPSQVRSVSVDFGWVVDPETHWKEIDEHLDAAGVNAVELAAGRVEFTGFDWPAHPGAAAEKGSDHIARAARALQRTSDGEVREFGLIVDAYVPEWIKEDPSLAGLYADGRRSEYQASASQLADGAVGERLVDYVVAIGERYRPASISVTELFLTASFGNEDLQLFERMTGRTGWPLTEDGLPDPRAEIVTTWRAEVIAEVLDRMRRGLDEVEGGREIELKMDVRVDWENPARGEPISGHDYRTLLRAADRLVLWTYLYRERSPAEIERLTAALAEQGLEMDRFAVSVGLWATQAQTDPPEAIGTRRFEQALRAAETNGVTEVNVTPLSLMSQELWDVLERVWGPKP